MVSKSRRFLELAINWQLDSLWPKFLEIKTSLSSFPFGYFRVKKQTVGIKQIFYFSAEFVDFLVPVDI